MTSRPCWVEGVMYPAHADESSDETKQRGLPVAAIFGSEGDWDAFELKWKERIGGKIFRASDCDTDQGDFPPSENNENKKLHADLSHLIADSGMIGHGVALNIRDFNEILAGKVDENPYYLCFNLVIVFLARRAGVCIPRGLVKFIFDRNNEIEYNAGQLYGDMMTNFLVPDYR